MSGCELCGGELIYLGTLGNRVHFECRQCGMQSSDDREAVGIVWDERPADDEQ